MRPLRLNRSIAAHLEEPPITPRTSLAAIIQFEVAQHVINRIRRHFRRNVFAFINDDFEPPSDDGVEVVMHDRRQYLPSVYRQIPVYSRKRNDDR